MNTYILPYAISGVGVRVCTVHFTISMYVYELVILFARVFVCQGYNALHTNEFVRLSLRKLECLTLCTLLFAYLHDINVYE